MKKFLTIVPTRNRNVKSKELAEEFFKTSKNSDLLLGLDEDDQHTYDRIDGVLYEVNPRMRLNGTLNHLAKKYCTQYDYICFMGDDHRPRTEDWDMLLYESIKDKKYGIAYGNDLIKFHKLPTAVFLDSKIIQELGFMAPPVLTHLFLDDFWRDLGNKLNTLVYSPDVIIEHMHYIRGKSELDQIYEEVNSKEMKNKDKDAYEKYLLEDFENDVRKLS